MTITDTPPRTQERAIKVRSGSSAQQIAGAISQALAETHEVYVRAMGASAVNQAVKAVCIARSYVAPRGLDLVCIPGMENTRDNARPGTSGSEELTCIVFRVFAR